MRTKPKLVTVPTCISNGSGTLVGMYVNNTTSGTMAIYDATTAASGYAITGTITPAIGSYNLYNLTGTQGIYIDCANINVTFYLLDAD